MHITMFGNSHRKIASRLSPLPPGVAVRPRMPFMLSVYTDEPQPDPRMLDSINKRVWLLKRGWKVSGMPNGNPLYRCYRLDYGLPFEDAFAVEFAMFDPVLHYRINYDIEGPHAYPRSAFRRS